MQSCEARLETINFSHWDAAPPCCLSTFKTSDQTYSLLSQVETSLLSREPRAPTRLLSHLSTRQSITNVTLILVRMQRRARPHTNTHTHTYTPISLSTASSLCRLWGFDAGLSYRGERVESGRGGAGSEKVCSTLNHCCALHPHYASVFRALVPIS